jgi:uncharacterized membrane protein|nr:MAG TPA: Minor capsid protein from bacteriophage [Caudoviricetes sp.]
MTIIESLRTWFAACPLLKDGLLNVDYLGADGIEYTIDADQPVNPILKKYTSGSSVRQFPFIFASRESYGADTLQNIANSGFYEKLAAWVEKQSEEENLPELDEYRTPQYIEVLSGGYPFDTGDSTARYQITMNFVYTQDYRYTQE